MEGSPNPPRTRTPSSNSDLISLSSCSSVGEENTLEADYHRTGTASTNTDTSTRSTDAVNSNNSDVISTCSPVSQLNHNFCGAITVGDCASGVSGNAAELNEQLVASSSTLSSQQPQLDSVYKVFDKKKLTISDFESTGLLFAKSSDAKFNK